MRRHHRYRVIRQRVHYRSSFGRAVNDSQSIVLAFFLSGIFLLGILCFVGGAFGLFLALLLAVLALVALFMSICDLVDKVLAPSRRRRWEMESSRPRRLPVDAFEPNRFELFGFWCRFLQFFVPSKGEFRDSAMDLRRSYLYASKQTGIRVLPWWSYRTKSALLVSIYFFVASLHLVFECYRLVLIAKPIQRVVSLLRGR